VEQDANGFCELLIEESTWQLANLPKLIIYSINNLRAEVLLIFFIDGKSIKRFLFTAVLGCPICIHIVFFAKNTINTT